MAVLIYNYRFTRGKNEVKSDTDQRIGYGERTTRKEDTDLLHTAHVLKPASGIFNMTDVAVVGKFAGARALGSVGSTTIIITLTTGILLGMGGGVNVVTALHMGAEDYRRVHKTVHTSVILCFIAGLLLLVTGLAFSKPLLEVMNTKPELIDGATAYLMIYLCGSPALALYNFGNGVLSAVGDTKRPLIYLSISGIINIVLNLFL